MKILVLDYPRVDEHCTEWERLSRCGTVTRYTGTTLPQLLERGRAAEVIITWSFPVRREILDYLTSVRTIIVPGNRRDELVETVIAEQLGITVLTVTGTAGERCRWIDDAAKLLEVSE
ncbi:MAG: hypothetical protein ACOC2V_03265 [Alkalispirochaeta sp.]